MESHRTGKAVLILLALAAALAALGLTVNPWPRDGWYQTGHLLVGRFPGWDDYTPIAAPAFLYLGAHAIASAIGLGLAGEFYVASLVQNLLALLDACFLYGTLELMGLRRLAGPLAIGFLLLVLSIGLPQCFYSENAALFLMSALVLALARVVYRPGRPNGSLQRNAVLCGALIGLLVLTRMMPVLLIPALALLLARRFPGRRVAQFTATVALITAVLLGGAIAANRARFGRYELTNSSGRHLWQGVKDFSDRALEGSSEYRALKRIDPHIQGKYWDRLPPVVISPDYVPYQMFADPREPVLRRLAIEAILAAPGLYLEHGAMKFVRTIGYAPSRDGFAGRSWWNPLRRTQSLPPLLDVMHAPRFCSAAVAAAARGVYAVLSWLYPILIFVSAASWLAVLVERLSAHLRRSALRRTDARTGAGAEAEPASAAVAVCVLEPSAAAAAVRGAEPPGAAAAAVRVPIAIFVAFGAALALIPVATGGRRPGAMIATLACAVLLAAGATLLHRALRAPSAAAQSPAALSFLGFSALVFFGSLYLTWQIEVQATRYAIPYLPFLTIMLALAGAYWRDLWAALRASRRPGRPRPAPLSEGSLSGVPSAPVPSAAVPAAAVPLSAA